MTLATEHTRGVATCPRCDRRGTLRLRRDPEPSLFGEQLGEWRTDVLCPCGSLLRVQPIKAADVGTSCNAACMASTAAHCDCSCGSRNHGILAEFK